MITMAQSSMLHIRLDEDLKQQAAKALASMGLTTSEAVRLLFHRIVADQAFPLELKVPNAGTRAAIDEARTLIANRRARFDDGTAMLAALDAESR